MSSPENIILKFCFMSHKSNYWSQTLKIIWVVILFPLHLIQNCFFHKNGEKKVTRAGIDKSVTLPPFIEVEASD